MTPEAMKPDEACEVPRKKLQGGNAEDAREIITKILEQHPEQTVANEQQRLLDERPLDESLPNWMNSLDIDWD